MKQRISSRSKLTAMAVGVLLLVAAMPAAAATEPLDTGWRLRFYIAAVDMEHSSDQLGSTGDFAGDTGGGVGLNAEYRFSRRLGIDVGLFSGGSVDIGVHNFHPGDTGWVTHDTLTFTPLTLGLDIHLTPDERVDFYACPLVAWTHYGRLSSYSGSRGVESEIDFSEDLSFGLRLGLGVPFGQNRWSFQVNATYLDSGLEGRGANGVRIDGGYDSTIFGVGVGYRFGSRAR